MLTLRLLCLARVRGGVSSLFSVLSVFGLFLIEDRKIFRGKIVFFRLLAVGYWLLAVCDWLLAITMTITITITMTITIDLYSDI